MEKRLLTLLLCAIVVLLIPQGAPAEPSATVNVTFTIPVMPGINAPLVEEETVQTADSLSNKADICAQEEARQEESEILEQGEPKEILMSNGETNSMIVKTIYSR